MKDPFAVETKMDTWALGSSEEASLSRVHYKPTEQLRRLLLQTSAGDILWHVRAHTDATQPDDRGEVPVTYASARWGVGVGRLREYFLRRYLRLIDPALLLSYLWDGELDENRVPPEYLEAISFLYYKNSHRQDGFATYMAWHSYGMYHQNLTSSPLTYPVCVNKEIEHMTKHFSQECNVAPKTLLLTSTKAPVRSSWMQSSWWKKFVGWF